MTKQSVKEELSSVNDQIDTLVAAERSDEDNQVLQRLQAKAKALEERLKNYNQLAEVEKSTAREQLEGM